MELLWLCTKKINKKVTTKIINQFGFVTKYGFIIHNKQPHNQQRRQIMWFLASVSLLIGPTRINTVAFCSAKTKRD